jgi:hypothetical protein
MITFFSAAAGVDPIAQSVALSAVRLDNDRIEQFRKKIAEEFAWNTGVRCVAKGAGCLVGLAACVGLYSNISLVQNDQLATMYLNNSAVQAMLASDVFKDNKSVQDAAGFFKASETQSGWKGSMMSWGSTLFRIVFPLVLSPYIGYLSQKFFYDPTIIWFVQQKTVIPTLQEQLQTLKADLDAGKSGRIGFSISDCNRYVEMILTLHNTLVDQLEQVIGYMRYKISILPLHIIGSLGADTAGTYLYNRVAAVADLLQNESAVHESNAPIDMRILSIGIMFDAVQQLMLQVSSNVAQFKVLEKKSR